MKRIINSVIVTTGLAIFSMLFGAGNLMYPLQVGLSAGSKNIVAFIGFFLTSLLLPLIGLVSVILFDGNYNEYFNRMGKRIGSLLILFCMLAIGPMIAMPRIVTLSYEMSSPFLPGVSIFVFSVIFLAITFLATYRESKIIELLGQFISPILLLCLGVIIGVGLFTKGVWITPAVSGIKLFTDSLRTGFDTMDLLGSIFFSVIVINILKATTDKRRTQHTLALVSLKAGAIGVGLLSLVYLGMSFLGAIHGSGLEAANPAKLFSVISFRILGSSGALVIATAVLFACLSTIIALAAVVAEYVQKALFKNNVNYITSLTLVLAITTVTSNFGLESILKFSAPILTIGYPVIIAVVFCNLAYKLIGFKPIKLPVALTFIGSIIAYLM